MDVLYTYQAGVLEISQQEAEQLLAPMVVYKANVLRSSKTNRAIALQTQFMPFIINILLYSCRKREQIWIMKMEINMNNTCL